MGVGAAQTEMGEAMLFGVYSLWVRFRKELKGLEGKWFGAKGWLG